MRSLKILCSIVLALIGTSLHAQEGVIKGRVYNSINNESIPFANIVIANTTIGVSSDIDGNFELKGLAPGSYNIICRYVGFKSFAAYEIIVSSARPTTLEIGLEEEAMNLEDVVVRAAVFTKSEESPVSLRTISAAEIYRNPGGNRDISKVIQVLPGVASTVSFRNDIIVRGGAPNENRFYLDGIEVPNINHFATQGSSGGPVGLINVNFIREVDFYSAAFPVNRGNAMSSVIDFKQITGNDEKLSGTFMLGSSDVGLTLDGPTGDKSSFIFSARRSYLQFLFKALGLPFLPTYNDFQYKHSFKINPKNSLTLIGLGAIDDFELNTGVNEGVSDLDIIERNDYILGNLPVNTQWNYTVGANWTHFGKNSYQTFVASRNMLNNNSIKYQQNIEDPAGKLLDYTSQEIENKFRFENTGQFLGWNWNYGAGFENVTYSNSTFNKKAVAGEVSTINFDSELGINKYALFAQVNKTVFNNRLTLSGGLRTDFNDFSPEMSNPLDQLSPRLSLSYAVNEKMNINASAGRFFQLPAYTVLGYRAFDGELINKTNKVTHVRADHLVAGVEMNPTDLSKITFEGFYKKYSNYPFLLNDGISLANLGGDFGVIGNEPVSSTSEGQSYGFEALFQQKLSSSIYGILSYTYVKSEFEDRNGDFVPSAWDNRHILNITAGKKFERNWEVGAKFRLQGGSPYTPYDVATSSLKAVWDVTQQGLLDYNRMNQERNAFSNGLDIRIDKRWYFNRAALDIYVDIQNVYNAKVTGQSFINVVKDAQGNPVTSLTNPLAYEIKEIENVSGTLLPSIGVMIEF